MKFFHTLSDFISKHAEKIVLLLAVVLSIVSFVYYYQADLITAYGDSRGHLNIARRVVDSLTPGVAQLGGYWLPLLHVLMLPTVWNDFMWQSGLSGSIPNMIAFVIAVLYMYRLGFLVMGNKLSAFIAASVLLFNPNLLYMQATPMTESLFVCTITVFMFYFYRWFREGRTSDLVLAAIFLVLSSLNRYEGWGLVIAANVLMLWRWVEHRFDKKMEGAMIAFGTLSFFGIFLWLLWGAVIFNDPLEFLHNTWMSTSEQGIQNENPKWLGDGDIFESTIITAHAIALVGGYLLFSLGVFSLFLYFIKNFRNLTKTEHVLPFIFLVPFIFDIITIYSGKIPITVPEKFYQYSGEVFNIRYALFSLPAVGFFISSIGKKNLSRYFIVTFVLLNSLFIVKLVPNETILLRDTAVVDTLVGKYNNDIDWLKNNYDGGLILTSAGGNDPFMFQSGFPQETFINEGTHKFWKEALENPSKYAVWVIISKDNPKDSLIAGIDRGVLEADFDLPRESENLFFFKRRYLR